MPQYSFWPTLPPRASAFSCVNYFSTRATLRRSVRRNVVDVGKPRGPVDQIIPRDDGSRAKFAGAQPPGGDFFAELGQANACRLRCFIHAIGNTLGHWPLHLRQARAPYELQR